MKLSQTGKQALKRFEGFKSCPYYDQVKVETIGIGTTIYPDGHLVKITDPCIDINKAYEYLEDHVNKRVIALIEPLIKKPLNQNQIDAVISIVYNIGAGRFKTSTLLRRINQDPNNKAGITEAFMMYVIAGGHTNAGLVARRKEEVKLYFSTS